MSKSQIQGAAGAMRKIAPLHRAVLVDGSEPLEFIECYWLNEAGAEADAPDLYAPAPRIPREVDADSCVGPLLGVLSILLVALVATAAVVWP